MYIANFGVLVYNNIIMGKNGIYMLKCDILFEVTYLSPVEK